MMMVLVRRRCLRVGFAAETGADAVSGVVLSPAERAESTVVLGVRSEAERFDPIELSVELAEMVESSVTVDKVESVAVRVKSSSA